MSPGRRTWAGGILAGAAGAAALLLAWPWVRGALIEPLAAAAWLLLRLLVLSLHQGVFWVGLVLAAAAALVGTLRRWARPAPEPSAARLPPWSAHPVAVWRQRIARTAGGLPAHTIGWNGYLQLVVALRATELRVPADHRLHDALRDGISPLPGDVHRFLFAPPAGPRRGRAGAHPRPRPGAALSRALRRLARRDRAERLGGVIALIRFLEDSLEMTSHDPDDPAPRPLRR